MVGNSMVEPAPLSIQWWIFVASSALVAGLGVYEAGGGIIPAAIVCLASLGALMGGAHVVRRRKVTRRVAPPPGAITASLSLLAGLGLVACLSAGGCTRGAWQTAVTATAVAAVGVDSANAAVTTEIGARELERVQAEGGTLADWCAAVHDAYDITGRITCGARAVADLALAGQAVLDAGETPGIEWARAACGALDAVVDAWGASDDPVPAPLAAARALACGLAGGSGVDPEPCVVEQPSVCESL